jgi:amidase
MHVCAGDVANESTELVSWSATKLAKHVLERKIASVEVVTAFINRIKQIEPKINAMNYLAENEALARAKKPDEALASGQIWGPLHGVPISIKDSLETIAIPTTHGAPKLKNYVPTQDATVVERLKRAGAIILAKSNVPLLSMWSETDNLVHGRTNNPYDLNCTPGGSSGGEAALIASMGSPLGIGTDAGGSIRGPSSWCGISGLCPALGRVPVSGIHPPVHENKGPSFWSVGPMTRRVEDLRLALSILKGPDSRDPFSFDLVPWPKAVEISKLRIAFFTEWVDEYGGIVQPTTETALAVENAARTFAKLGAKIKQVRPPLAEYSDRVICATSFPQQAISDMQKQAEEFGAPSDPLIEGIAKWATGWQTVTSKKERDEFQSKLPALRVSLLQFFESFDVMLMPVSSRPAPVHRGTFLKENLSGLGYTSYINLVGSLPSGTVRCSTSPENLPIGVMVVGKRWREDIVLEILASLEQTFGGWIAPPVENLS